MVYLQEKKTSWGHHDNLYEKSVEQANLNLLQEPILRGEGGVLQSSARAARHEGGRERTPPASPLSRG